MNQNATLIQSQSKSVGVSVILSLLFGGLGLFYASIVGGIVMTLAELAVVAITFFTLGFGAILFPFIHIICLIWSIVAVNSHNKKLVLLVNQSNV